MTDSPHEQRRQRLTGIGLMCGAVALFAALDAIAKYLGGHLDTLQVVAMRFISAFFIAFAFSNPLTRPGLLKTAQPGLQFVRVHTKRGWVVIASDVAHYYENMDSVRPFTTAYHVGDMLEAYDKVKALAPGRDHIIPGHDPLVMKLYPAPRPDLEGTIVRLDVMPRSPG